MSARMTGARWSVVAVTSVLIAGLGCGGETDGATKAAAGNASAKAVDGKAKRVALVIKGGVVIPAIPLVTVRGHGLMATLTGCRLATGDAAFPPPTFHVKRGDRKGRR